MFTEQEIEKLMAEVILRTVKESKFSTNIKDFCAENQIDRGKLMAKKLFRMLNATLFRIMMGIAQLVSFEEFVAMCLKIACITPLKASNGLIWVLLSEEKQKQKSLTLKNSDDDE